MTQTYLAFQLEGSEESIFVDATTMHDPSFTSNLTAHPVESGSDITDHARAEPDRVSFEFIISDAPTKGATGGTMNPVESSGRARFSFELLNGLRIKGTLFRVVTAFRSYNNMAIKSLAPVFRANVAGVVQFRAEFQEIRVVDSKTVELRIPKRVTKAKPTSNMGNQSGKQVDTSDNAILYNTFVESGVTAKTGAATP